MKRPLQIRQSGFDGVSRKQTNIAADGTFRFEDAIHVADYLKAEVITTSAWLLEIFDLQQGTLHFPDAQPVAVFREGRIAVYYAPFSITRIEFKKVKGELVGFAAHFPAGESPILGSCTFSWPSGVLPQTLNEVLFELPMLSDSIRIELQVAEDGIAARAKKVIDRNYHDNIALSAIAEQLGVSHEHMSRQFKRSYGMSAGKYRHKLRMADAVAMLATGDDILGVSADVGYNDLSRFYQQFRQFTGASPGNCQLKWSRT